MDIKTPTFAPAYVALPILFRPCAWHTPQPELDALNRQHPGQVSHSICPACAARLEQEIA